MAIAYDSVATGSGAGSTITFSHTCSGSNRLLFVAVQTSLGDVITGVTYNGVALTLIDKIQTNVANNEWAYLFYLANPATGANNVVISKTGSDVVTCQSISYTGCSQTGIPDSTAKLANSDDPLVVSTTTVADNCWIVGSYAGNRDIVAGANTVLRGYSGQFSACDSNGAKTPAGSHSLSIDQVGSPAINAMVVASFAPFVPPITNANFLMFM